MYNFNDMKGNRNIIEKLRNSISGKRVSHAYIFEGEKGSGKKLIARSFSKALLCKGYSGEACGKCISCKTFDSGNNPDIIFVKSENKTVGVDVIRGQINSTVFIKPYSGQYKIYIIENAGTMTVQAQNALLKTLEEPAEYAVFLLLADSEEVFLPTILSRCVIFRIRPLTQTEIFNYLIDEKRVDADEAEFLSFYADGSIGRALEIMTDDNFRKMRELIIDIVNKIEGKDLFEMFEGTKKITEYKDRAEDVLYIFKLWFRDLLMLMQFSDSNQVIQKDIENKLLNNTGIGIKAALACLEAIDNAAQALRHNANLQLVLEVLLITIHDVSKKRFDNKMM